MWSGVEKFMFCADDGIRLQLTGFPSTLTFNNNSGLQMSNSPGYPPWRRLLLQGFWQTRAQLFLNSHTWAFPRYLTNNRTVATRRMHDGWSLAFMKSINLDQTWRQKSQNPWQTRTPMLSIYFRTLSLKRQFSAVQRFIKGARWN